MKTSSGVKLFAMAFAATLLSLVCLLKLGAIEGISYAMERGRLRALRESLTESNGLAGVSEAGRIVAETVAPAVVSIEAEIRTPLEAVVQLEHEPGPPATEAPEYPGRLPPLEPDRDQDGGDEQPIPPLLIQQGVGSGFIFDADRGHLLTSAHVVDRADSVRVLLSDGRQAEARVLGCDLDSDL
jgi:S1-C subfamily serine protease